MYITTTQLIILIVTWPFAGYLTKRIICPIKPKCNIIVQTIIVLGGWVSFLLFMLLAIMVVG
jgi:hypothetical protein